MKRRARLYFAEGETENVPFGRVCHCCLRLIFCGDKGAAAILGTGMLNRIAESPQFVKPQAKLSTVLAGSDGDWCESPAPNGLSRSFMKRRLIWP